MIKRILAILAAPVLCFSQGSTNDYIFYQKPATGPLVVRPVTPSVGKLIGWPSSINAPAAITIGTGLDLTAGVLTSTGGTPAWGDITGIPAAITTLSSATAAGLALMDDANASAQRTTLGLGTISTQASSSVGITGGTMSGMTAVSTRALTVTPSSGTNPKITLNNNTTAGSAILEYAGSNTNVTYLLRDQATGGTLISTGDTGTVTGAMIAQSGATSGQALAWNGSAWAPATLTGAALASANTFTALNKFTGGLESYWGNVTDNGAVLGLNAGITSVSSDPVAIGFNAVGGNVAPGASVIGIGRHAGYSATGGNWVALGHAAGQYAHTADNAVLIGYLAGRNSTNQPSFSIWDSVMIGHNAGAQADSAAASVMVGSEAGKNATSSIGAVMIGYAAGQNATTATNAVLIGRQAGSALTNAANKLVIDGDVTYSTGATGLLYGEFDNRLFTVNAATINLGTSGAAVNIGGGSTAAELRFMEPSAGGTSYTGFKAPALAGNVLYTLPTTDGTSGQTLTTNGSGALSWASAGGGSGSVRKITVVTKTDTASVTPGSNTWATVWSFSYTPSQSNSVILLRGVISAGVSLSIPIHFRLLNGSTALSVGATAGSRSPVGGGISSNGTSPDYYGIYTVPFLASDTPGTTSSQTYNLQFQSASGGATLHLNRSGDDGDYSASPRGISSIEIVELAP